MPNLFISYRRIDTGQEAARLADGLERALGRHPVFRDVDSIAPGVVFEEEIDRRIGEASAVLVLIGPDWLAELRRREGLPALDYVRREVTTALRLGKRVIPVLIREARLPDPNDLPADLQALPRRHVQVLRDDEHWQAGVERLLDAVGRPVQAKWVLARGVGALLVAVLFAWRGLPTLLPETGIDEARLAILLLLGLWAFAECAHWYRARGRGR